MNTWLSLQPRRADALRNVQAVRLAANTCAQLPVGFWQRRLAARAFGLSVVPPVDRHEAARAVCWTLGGADPVFVLETGVALWGLAPTSDRDPVETLQMLRAVGRRPFTAVISVGPVSLTEPLGAPDRAGRMHILPSDALQIGVLHWHDLATVFDDAAQTLAHPPLVALASHAATTLRQLEEVDRADRPHPDDASASCSAAGLPARVGG